MSCPPWLGPKRVLAGAQAYARNRAVVYYRDRQPEI